VRLQEGDVLVLSAPTSILVSRESEPGIRVSTIEPLQSVSGEETLQMIVPHNSRYIGKNFADLNLDPKYKANVVALRKGDKRMTGRLERIRLAIGDMLLIKTRHVQEIRQDPGLMVIDYLDSNYRKEKLWIALAIMAGVVIIAALGIYPILVTALFGVLAMMLAGVVTPEEAYGAVRWDVIFLLAGLIPLGIALEKSGAAALIASLVSSLTEGMPVLLVVKGL